MLLAEVGYFLDSERIMLMERIENEEPMSLLVNDEPHSCQMMWSSVNYP